MRLRHALPSMAIVAVLACALPATAGAQAIAGRKVPGYPGDPAGDSFGPPGSDITGASFVYSPDDGYVFGGIAMDPAHPVPTVLTRVIAGVYTADGRCDASDGVVVDIAPGAQSTTYHLPGNPDPITQFAPVALTGRAEVIGRTFTCAQAASISDDGSTVYDGTGPAPMYDLAVGPPPGYLPAPPPPSDPVAPAPAPAPVPPAPRVTLRAVAPERVARLRFRTGATTPGAYTVVVRLGATRLARSLVVRRAGSIVFGLTPSAAERRRLRRSLSRGALTAHATITGLGTSATASARVSR